MRCFAAEIWSWHDKDLDALAATGATFTSMTGYLHDEAEWADYGTPVAVVRPGTAQAVRDVVRACLAHRVPVVTRGWYS